MSMFDPNRILIYSTRDVTYLPALPKQVVSYEDYKLLLASFNFLAFEKNRNMDLTREFSR